jgi:hypothetical protein
MVAAVAAAVVVVVALVVGMVEMMSRGCPNLPLLA